MIALLWVIGVVLEGCEWSCLELIVESLKKHRTTVRGRTLRICDPWQDIDN